MQKDISEYQCAATLLCHGLPPVSSSNHAVNTARRALVSYTGAVPREGVISPTPEEWANGVEALRTESNKLADALLQSAERVKNYPNLLSVPWENVGAAMLLQRC